MPPKMVISQMIFGFATAKAVHVAAKLNIADLIKAHGPMTCAELAKECDADKDALYRVLRALASVGIFAEDQNGKFALTPIAECLEDDHPDTMKAMAIVTGNVFYQAYGEFLYSVKTGKPGFAKAVGMSPFEYLGKNPEEGKLFDRMMTEFHGKETEPMVNNYDFSVFKTVVDVGGGNGSVIAAVLNKYPTVSGRLFDLPEVINRSRENIESWGLSKRCQVDEGSFFEAVSKGGDAYILRHIIHDWSDEDSLTILSNCRKAMNPGGKILVAEAVIPKGNDPHPYKWLDLTMLLIGGKERTKEQFENLFSKAGLKLTRIIPVDGEISLVEGVAG